MSVTAATPFSASRIRPTPRSLLSRSARRLRAGASSSTTNAEMGLCCGSTGFRSSPAQWNADGNLRASAFSPGHREAMVANPGIERFQSFASDPYTNPGRRLHSPTGRQSNAVIDHVDLQLAARALCRDADRPTRQAAFNSMADRVFDDRLEQHRWNHRPEHRRIDLDMKVDPLTKAALLNRDIMVEQRQLLG